MTPASQKDVLRYLDACNHATKNIMRRVWGGRFPGAAMHALIRKGFVTATPSREILSTNYRFEITEAGRAQCRTYRDGS